MNKIEAQILHGIYFHREHVGEKMIYKANELNWLANTPIPKGKNWLDSDDKLKTLDDENEDYLASICATSATAEKPLAYLKASGYIEYTKDNGVFRISVTANGADVARKLDKLLGRLNIFYNFEKKLFWVGSILAIIISAFTVWDKLLVTEPARLIAEFTVTKEKEINIAPEADSIEADWTNPIPLPVRVKNSGGKTAKHTIMRIFHDRNFQIHSNTKNASVQFMYNSYGGRFVTTIPLGDMHPGQAIELGSNLFAIAENTMEFNVDLKPSPSNPNPKATLTALARYELEIHLNAEDLTEQVQELVLLISKHDRTKGEYFKVDGKELIKKSNRVTGGH